MHEPEPEAVFDERRWEKIETVGDGYSPRTGHTVVTYGTSLYVFGGTDRRRRQQDLFQYDIEHSSWSIVNALGPLPPRRSGALGVVYGAKMYIFGGYDGRDGNYFNDLYYFNFETRSWSEMPCRPGERPEARTDHIMVLHDAKIYIYGGYDGSTRYQNMYRYDLKLTKWELLHAKGVVPSRRFGHSGGVHEASNALIVFGGWDGKDTLNDLYSYGFEDQEWTKLQATGSPPPHRYRHTSVIFDHSMFVFGGVDKQHCRYNDLQRLDLRNNSWSQVCTTGFVPSSRTFHRAVVVGNLMYLLGGYDGTDRLHDLFSVHVGTLTPASLLSMCATYMRNNFKQVAEKSKFDGIPRDLVDWVIWRRDMYNNIRGRCKLCPEERCRNYGRVRNQLNTMETQSSFFTSAPYLTECMCVCGHANIEHFKIHEKTIYSEEMLSRTKKF